MSRLPLMRRCITPWRLCIIAEAQQAEFFTADAVIEQGGEDCAIPYTLQRVRGRGLKQSAGLRITQRGRATLVAVRSRPFHSILRIAQDGIPLAERVEAGILARIFPFGICECDCILDELCLGARCTHVNTQLELKTTVLLDVLLCPKTNLVVKILGGVRPSHSAYRREREESTTTANDNVLYYS